MRKHNRTEPRWVVELQRVFNGSIIEYFTTTRATARGVGKAHKSKLGWHGAKVRKLRKGEPW